MVRAARCGIASGFTVRCRGLYRTTNGAVERAHGQTTLSRHSDVVRLVGSWADSAPESGGFRTRSKTRRQQRENARTDSNGSTPAAGCNRLLEDHWPERSSVDWTDGFTASPRVSAAVGMRVADYYPQGRRMWFRLHEKGGKHHEVPAHHNAEIYLDAYLQAADIGDEKRSPLFRTISRYRQLTLHQMHRADVLRMIKRRASQAGLPEHVSCHTFRATGITTYLENGGSLEHAQRIAAHNSVRTTKLYDRTSDAVTLDEIERIVI